eukprot:8868327-Pyramimonas_sp.AAC.1
MSVGAVGFLNLSRARTGSSTSLLAITKVDGSPPAPSLLSQNELSKKIAKPPTCCHIVLSGRVGQLAPRAGIPLAHRCRRALR